MCVCIYIYSPCLILFFVFFALSCFVHFYLLQLKRVSLTTDKHLDLGSRSAVVVSHFSSTDGLIGWCHYLACASNVFRDMMISFWQFFHCLTLPRPGAVWRLSSLFSLTLWRLGRPRYLLYFFFLFCFLSFFPVCCINTAHELMTSASRTIHIQKLALRRVVSTLTCKVLPTIPNHTISITTATTLVKYAKT